MLVLVVLLLVLLLLFGGVGFALHVTANLLITILLVVLLVWAIGVLLGRRNW